MAKSEHGWSNDATWTVASAIENNQALHETATNEASLAIAKAIEGMPGMAHFGRAKQLEAARNVAAKTLGYELRKRFREFFEVFAHAVYAIIKQMPPDARDMAGVVLMLGHEALNDVDWSEIGRHYVSGLL